MERMEARKKATRRGRALHEKERVIHRRRAGAIHNRMVGVINNNKEREISSNGVQGDHRGETAGSRVLTKRDGTGGGKVWLTT